MYNFIYFVLYKGNTKDGSFIARFQASLIVFISLVIHFAFLAVIIKKISYKYFEYLPLDILTKNKVIEIIIFLIIQFCIYFYYNPARIGKIMNKYAMKTSSVNNTIITLVIIFLPLTLLILIGWKR